MSKTISSKPKPKRSSQGPFVIWHGMTLSGVFELLSKRPGLHWKRIGFILMLPIMGLYNSVMSAIENLFYSRRVKEVRLEHPPIFILGFWRSGTTLLHNLMTSDPQFAYPNLYQTMFPSHFLLTEKVATKLTAFIVPKSRPMDNMAVSWSVPQEDEVALCITTLISPYSVLAFPGDTDEYKPSLHIESLPEAKQNRWKAALDLFVRKIAVLSPKQIVLKSPSHTYRVETLLKMYPDAKFVYIYRDPFAVFNSACHLRRTMIEENTLGKTIFKDVENDIITIYKQAFDQYQSDKSLIPEGHLCEVKYEDLAAEPVQEMNKIYESLNLENVEGMRTAVEPQVEKLKNYKKNHFEPDPHWAKQVFDRCRDAYDLFGYAPPLAELSDEKTTTDS